MVSQSKRNSGVDVDQARAYIENAYAQSIVPTLIEYIRIPNKSPMFDPDWQSHGHMDRAVDLLSEWAGKHPVPGMKMEVVRLPERTPVILLEIPATGASASTADEDTVLLYGHLDKQPEMVGWDQDKGPWIPVLEGDKLYGRGGADDGYALFASLTALRVLKEQDLPHKRCVVLIEACEESGSFDLPYYIDALRHRIGNVSLVVCLDSGCGNYDQLWCTTSLRGMLSCNLRIDILSEGVHSGDAGGVVASSFRILRQLLDRLEGQDSGNINLPELFVQIPRERVEQAALCSEILGKDVYDKYPFVQGASPTDKNLGELVLNRTWRPTVTVTGIDGIPSMANAGNVMLPYVEVKLSMRLPPTLDSSIAASAVERALTIDPPYGATVTVSQMEHVDGWDAPPMKSWLTEAVAAASERHFGRPAAYMGEGGSIPFMGMLGKSFPEAQFIITGVLGPKSNAHGPNEFLHIPTAKRLTACVADILVRHHAQ